MGEFTAKAGAVAAAESIAEADSAAVYCQNDHPGQLPIFKESLA